MNSRVLIKINSIIKNRLIELLGILLVLVSVFLLASIVSYSPNDPNFIYTPENTEIKNKFGEIAKSRFGVDFKIKKYLI